MKAFRRRLLSLGTAGLCFGALVGSATAAGVTAGSSTLFSVPDYLDSFTGTASGGIPGRPYVAAPLPSYPIEVNFGNPSTHYIQQVGSEFSIAGDADPGPQAFVQTGGGGPAYPTSLGGNASGAGSDTGFTQTGGGPANLGYGIDYSLRDEYVVQFDAIQVDDRIDITSGDVPTGNSFIAASNSISVFFRGNGTGQVSVYNGAVDNVVPGMNTGIAAWNAPANGGQSRWYNYAVRFDRPDNEIEIYVDQNSLGVIDLDTFAGGAYSAGFSNKFVSVSAGLGDNTRDRVWTDNFQVGGEGAPNLPTTVNVFTDDFNRPNGPATGYRTFRGNWAVDNQRLVLSNTTTEAMAFVGDQPFQLPTDYEFSFDWEYIVPGNAVGKHAGALFNWDHTADRFNKAAHGYNLYWIDRASDFGLSLVRLDGVTPVALHTGTGALLAEPPDNVRIQVEGDNIRVYADGLLVIDVMDNTYRGGRAALWSYSANQTVAFDNVRVAVPEPGTVTLAALGALGLVALRLRRRKDK
jgi:hypothetical protein